MLKILKMSFSSDLWNGFDILKKNFLQTYNKIKHFYEIIFSFASLEKNHSKNLEILYEQNKDLFNSDEILLLPSKTFISSLKIESEYHKYYYNNIFDNILSPLKNIIDNKKYLITKTFCDSMKNTDKFNKIIQNIISKQENYYNSCKELSVCLSEIEIYAINTETKKKQSVNKTLISKKDKAMEKLNRMQNEYLNIITESNVILKDYNLKTDILLNDLEKEFKQINTCIKDCLINYSKNKIQLSKDILDMTNHGLNTCYEKIDIDNDIKNFIMKNATKEFKYHKFEYNPFKLKDINKNLLFNDVKENSKIQPVNYDRVIQNVKKFFVDNKITGTDSDYIERMVNSLKKIKLELSIKYDLLLNINKNDDNKNLIIEFPKNENNNIINTNIHNNKIADKEKEIMNNIKYVENFINKLTTGELDLENDISKIKTMLQKNKENFIYLEYIIRGLNNYRSHGNYILKEKTYEYFLNLFIFILENFSKNDYIIKNLLTFSQTFYKINKVNKNPKYYILYSISNNSLFNKSETWHKLINYSLTNFAVNKDLSIKMEKEEREKKLSYNIYNILVENFSIMKLFGVNDKIYDGVKNYFIQLYKINYENLTKDIENFYKENYYSINQENEKELIKGEDKTLLLKNKKEDNKEQTNDEKNKKEDIKKESDKINIINEEKKDENKNVDIDNINLNKINESNENENKNEDNKKKDN